MRSSDSLNKPEVIPLKDSLNNHQQYSTSAETQTHPDRSGAEIASTVQLNNVLKTSKFKFTSIRWKILMIAVITTIAFSAYLAFNLSQSNNQATLLEDIRDKRYPVQIKLQQAAFTLRFIQAQMQDAVITGDLDSLDEANTMKEQFLEAMNAVQQLDSERAKKAASIKHSFNNYVNDSYLLANDLISGKVDLTRSAERGSHNATQYHQLVAEIDAFKALELENFSLAVSRVTARANAIVEFGVPVGLLTMLAVFFLAMFTSRSITGRVNHMVNTLRDIAQDDGDMSVRIPVRGEDEMAQLSFWFNQFIGKLERVTEASTTEIKRLAYTDALTQLPNRRLFNSHLKSEIRRCHQQHCKLAVMFLDLDNFKAINDQMGHDAGDILVRKIGERLSRTVRGNDLLAYNPEEDAQPGQHLVARMGGDEFMLTITDLKDNEQASIVAERVRENILKPIVINSTTLEIGVSIGIAVYPDDGKNTEELIVNADLAMYEAKNSGKNNYCFYHQGLESESRRNLQIETALRNALVTDELELYFLPKFNVVTNHLVGAEALLRWMSPTLGQVSPAQFIPVAESCGLIFDIDEWVMCNACRQMNQWIGAGYELKPIAINVSARQAAKTDLVSKIKNSLDWTGLPPQYLEIEITETSALSNLQQVADNILALKDLGVSVALDDFGAGHSSLSLLKYCEIDTLKIDQGFLGELHNPGGKPIYRAVIELAKVLGLKTVAEGIEQTDELEAIRKMGCNIAQGYLLARPMPAAEFEQLLIQHSNGEPEDG